MINKVLSILLILVLILSSCASNIATDTPASDNYAEGVPEPLRYNFVIFDSDGDGVKDDIAELTCLGMSGGYGSFRLEVFIYGENRYRKVFDSEQYSLNQKTYEKLAKNINGELIIDTFYSVDAVDTDKDGCEELVCRQYVWVDSHANHVGDVISIFKMNNDGEIIDVRFDANK